MSAQTIIDEIRALDRPPSVGRDSQHTDVATEMLLYNVKRHLVPVVTHDWMAQVAPLFKHIQDLAEDPQVSDSQLYSFIHNIALTPEAIFEALNHDALQKGLESVIAPAMINGAVEVQQKYLARL